MGESQVSIDSSELEEIQLPRETLYLIDKIVRQRTSMGPFGMDNSEIINEEERRLNQEKNREIQRLVEGVSSVSKVESEDEIVSLKKGNLTVDTPKQSNKFEYWCE